MGLAKLASGARSAARKVADSESTAVARRLAARGTANLGPRIRELIAMDEDTPITPETLLRQAIVAVHGDEEVELTLEDVRDMGKRNERLVAAAGILGGGPGCVIADLYADAALFCLLDRCFELGLSDEDIGAYLLVAWNAAPDLERGRQIMDVDDPASIAEEARARFDEEVNLETKRESVLALWRMRSGLARMPLFDPSSFRDLFRAGWTAKKRFNEAAELLGLPNADLAHLPTQGVPSLTNSTSR